MYVFEKKKNAKSHKPWREKSSAVFDASPKPVSSETEQVTERNRSLELANAARLRAKKKQSQEAAIISSGLGAFLMAISHTSATACRVAVTNPYLFAAGGIIAAIGVGLLVYFGIK